MRKEKSSRALRCCLPPVNNFVNGDLLPFDGEKFDLDAAHFEILHILLHFTFERKKAIPSRATAEMLDSLF